MKKIKFLILAAIAFNFYACTQCEEVIMEPCGEITPNLENCGMTVVTCWAEPNTNLDVGSIYDTRLNSQAPKGDDWGTTTSAPQVTAIHPSNWTTAQLGQVFGVAIDNKENIYLASSDIYTWDGTLSVLPSSNLPGARPYSPGQIFKCDKTTGWFASPFAVVPINPVNINLPLNGTGNIAYDKTNDQFFVTNLDDGFIYRISNGGLILETYDPWAVSGSTPMRIVDQDERVWGIGVNEESGDVKVYFPRVTTPNPISLERSIYSITLVGDAFPPAGSEVKAIQNVPGTQVIISDLAFSNDNNEMLVSERGQPHFAKVISYSLSGGVWTYNRQYFVGANAGADGENSAGGVDFAYTENNGNVSDKCDEFFWASGNFMDTRNSTSLNKVYGIEGIAYSGNNSSSAISPTANQDTDIFIDFDGVGGTGPKRTIGDVEVFDCTECGSCDLNGAVN